ncbi:MAG: DUF4412 domain-containing protein [Capsulimonadaceae bacterium]
MLRRLFAVLAGIVAAAAVTGPPAMADITLTSHMTIDSPQLRAELANIPAQYRNMIPNLTDMTNTISVSGKKIKIDMPMPMMSMSIVMDSAGDKTIELYNFNKTYYVTKYDPTLASQMLSGPVGSDQQATPSDYVVTETGKTSTMIGHSVHEFVVTSKVKNEDGTTTTINADIWAAQDVPAVDTAGFAALLPAGSGKTHVTGVPLSTTTTYKGGPEDGTTVKSVITAISNDAIADSTFQIPSDYTQTTTPAMPGAGPSGAGGSSTSGSGTGAPQAGGSGTGGTP